MAKRNRSLTDKKLDKKIKAGHGCGRSSQYESWLKIQDVASLGRSTRMLGWKTDRINHCLSDLERNYLLLLDWSDKVIDIREQFPLLPLEQTLQIANELNIKHPTDPKTKQPIVMTTDFLVTIKDRYHVIDSARTLKYSKDLDSPRILEKFQIEKIYWHKKGIDWGIVTEMDIPKVMAENIRHLRQSYFMEDDIDFSPKDLPVLSQYLIQKLRQSYLVKSISEITREFDEQLYFEAGSGLKLFKYLLAKKKIWIDIACKLNFNTLNVVHFPEDTLYAREMSYL